MCVCFCYLCVFMVFLVCVFGMVAGDEIAVACMAF